MEEEVNSEAYIDGIRDNRILRPFCGKLDDTSYVDNPIKNAILLNNRCYLYHIILVKVFI